MRTILNTAQMQGADRYTIDTLGVPGPELMEHAGQAVCDVLRRQVADLGDQRVVVLCGKGNNGGDGFVVARHMYQAGMAVTTLLFAPLSAVKGDAKQALDRYRKTGGAVTTVTDAARWKSVQGKVAAADLVIDALFGTGLAGPVRDFLAGVIADVNAMERRVVAVDLPSGFSADSDQVPAVAMEAEATVTFAAYKIPHALPPAMFRMGEVAVEDIGIPEEAIQAQQPEVFLVDAEDMERQLQALGRPRDAHKGTFGHVLVVAGSLGKMGAALMAARAALRGGAGLVTLACPAACAPIAQANTLEVMVEALPETPAGTVAPEAAARVQALMESRDLLVLGPGLSQEPETQAMVREVVARSSLPIVLDADGLNAFQDHLAGLEGLPVPVVLTPHPGEMGRLLGRANREVVGDRLRLAQTAAREHGVYLVLKGYRTLSVSPEGKAWINPTGNPGMATGGTGDVLAGLIGGLCLQGMEGVCLERIALAVYLHGLAGDLAASDIGEIPLMATDLLWYLPQAFRACLDAGGR